ncbi:MAG TPA: bifunctional diaminohydroxyphosphoribosylaminopyrimidine deaminase/5-amino-6-(5-phosphoribosylamino)uracil reductase RibD [Opitutales bacterium]|jgi:diaminohydroxyphosphoribosylaminopyrimidine deaminase/5-amino-6-(5-phosphoribosylamino)uracil reductase|nr:bifunctional diaminohydroxyphosphoribosylaminopyrimidine deaminase/5-amino-6-(5-phosphoribosylamino)uracil reductase RibD [Opitutales bacterium]
MNNDRYAGFMRRALEAARRGWGETHPNPMVGAVLVENGRVVADGYHARAGEPHAEMMALRNLGRAPAPGATLYVTLEPCCTTGRTPPCTEAVIRAGIKHVVVGATDPNPQHQGQGFAQLRAAGVEVVEGILAEECADLNLIFNHHITTGRALFAGKIATTLDGRMATRTGQSKWITGPTARRDAMHWRRLFTAIGVGAGTVLADDPQLTSRNGKAEWCPVRLIFDRTLRTVTEKLPQVYVDAHRARTIVVTGALVEKSKYAILENQGVAVWTLPAKNDAAWFAGLRQKCAEAGLSGLLIEGGPKLLSAFLQADELDYLFAYRAPKFLADAEAAPVFTGPPRPRLADAFTLKDVRHASLGDDQLLRGFIEYPQTKN